MSGSAFRRSVQVFVSRNLTPEAQSRRLAQIAVEGRDELIRTGRAAPVYSTFVDGREGAAEASVKPQGTIVYRFQVLGEAALFAMAFLRQRSPIDSGRFRDSFVYAVGQAGTRAGRLGASEANFWTTARIIQPGSFDPQKVAANVDAVLLFARAPYSRKIDVQMVGKRRLRFSVPADMIDDAAAAVRRRFPTLNARRIYTVRFPGQWVRKRGTGAGRLVENPALVISVR
jgi:hypothetical protein